MPPCVSSSLRAEDLLKYWESMQRAVQIGHQPRVLSQVDQELGFVHSLCLKSARIQALPAEQLLAVPKRLPSLLPLLSSAGPDNTETQLAAAED